MGYAPSCDYPNGNFAPLIDKMLGNAFWLVKKVADALPFIQYNAQNMEVIVSAGGNATAAASSATASAASAAAASASAIAAANSASTASAAALQISTFPLNATNLAILLATLPTTPPSQPGIPWLQDGFLKISQ